MAELLVELLSEEIPARMQAARGGGLQASGPRRPGQGPAFVRARRRLRHAAPADPGGGRPAAGPAGRVGGAPRSARRRARKGHRRLSQVRRPRAATRWRSAKPPRARSCSPASRRRATPTRDVLPDAAGRRPLPDALAQVHALGRHDRELGASAARYPRRVRRRAARRTLFVRRRGGGIVPTSPMPPAATGFSRRTRSRSAISPTTRPSSPPPR